MTTHQNNDDLDAMAEIAESATQILKRRVEDMVKARDEQPARLAKAREDADEARGWALIEEPWSTLITALPTYNSAGQRTGDSFVLPSITAKELFGARLAFDLLDCGDDFDRIDEVQNRYFAELKGDTGLLFLVAFAALSTIAGVVVPQILDDLEQSGSNYDARVLLAEARAKAWRGRVAELRGRVGDDGGGDE